MPDSGHALRWERLVATLDSLLDSKPAITDGTSSMQRQKGKALEPDVTRVHAQKRYA